MTTHIKCFGRIEEGITRCHLEGVIGHWLFTYGERWSDAEGEHAIGTAAVVPAEFVKDNRFIGDDISRFEITDTYAMHILANACLIKSVAI